MKEVNTLGSVASQLCAMWYRPPTLLRSRSEGDTSRLDTGSGASWTSDHTTMVEILDGENMWKKALLILQSPLATEKRMQFPQLSTIYRESQGLAKVQELADIEWEKQPRQLVLWDWMLSWIPPIWNSGRTRNHKFHRHGTMNCHTSYCNYRVPLSDIGRIDHDIVSSFSQMIVTEW